MKALHLVLQQQQQQQIKQHLGPTAALSCLELAFAYAYGDFTF